MNNGGLNNAAFYDYSSDEELDQIEGDNQAFGMAMNRAAGPVRLLAQRRQLPAVPAPLPIQTPPIAIDWIDLSACGFPESVALSELPGSTFRGRHRDLTTDLSAILRNDITDVVCLLTEPEFRKFRVRTLLDKYESSGLVVYHFPIEDGMIPTSVSALNRLLVKIRKRIADGNRVLIHCYGGLGRAVLVGACLTLAIDVDATPTEVISQMRLLRGPRAVQSVKQYNFINEYRELSITEEQLGYRDDDNESCVSR